MGFRDSGNVIQCHTSGEWNKASSDVKAAGEFLVGESTCQRKCDSMETSIFWKQMMKGLHPQRGQVHGRFQAFKDRITDLLGGRAPGYKVKPQGPQFFPQLILQKQQEVISPPECCVKDTR
jgi:hypothetical protein